MLAEILGGSPRRFLKFVNQSSSRFSRAPPLTMTDGLVFLQAVSLIVFQAAAC